MGKTLWPASLPFFRRRDTRRKNLDAKRHAVPRQIATAAAQNLSSYSQPNGNRAQDGFSHAYPQSFPQLPWRTFRWTFQPVDGCAGRPRRTKAEQPTASQERRRPGHFFHRLSTGFTTASGDNAGKPMAVNSLKSEEKQPAEQKTSSPPQVAGNRASRPLPAVCPQAAPQILWAMLRRGDFEVSSRPAGDERQPSLRGHSRPT